jgi:hypothetical protein
MSRVGIVEPLEADTLGNIEPGDLQQGSGLSTSQLGRVTISRNDDMRQAGRAAGEAMGKSGLQNAGEALMGKKVHGGSSLMIFGIIVGLLLLIRFVAEKAGERSEFASVRIGLENLAVVGLLATIWIYGEKIAVALLPWDNSFTDALREFVGVV